MISPCIGVCQLKNNACLGCQRTLEDIAQWKDMTQAQQEEWWMNHPIYYAGVGSRDTPQEHLERMTHYSKSLHQMQWTLRSGGARGADTYFELGSQRNDIFLPERKRGKKGTALEDLPLAMVMQAQKIGKPFHPRWGQLDEFSLKLMTRNVFQVLGRNLQTPVKFILFWAPSSFDSDGLVKDAKGGTGFAIRLGRSLGIPLIHVNHPTSRPVLEAIEEQNLKRLHQELQRFQTAPTLVLPPSPQKTIKPFGGPIQPPTEGKVSRWKR